MEKRWQDFPGGPKRGGGTLFPQRCLAFWKWKEEVGGGETGREGGGCRNVTYRTGPGRGDFQSGSSALPPSTTLSWASPASCHQALPASGLSSPLQGPERPLPKLPLLGSKCPKAAVLASTF